MINSKEIALRGDEWRKRVYFHHNTYHGGATWTLAWELHHKDPTLVIDFLQFRNTNDINLYIVYIMVYVIETDCRKSCVQSIAEKLATKIHYAKIAYIPG